MSFGLLLTDAKAEIVDGFITQIHSHRDFDLGSVLIHLDNHTACEIREAVNGTPPVKGWGRDYEVSNVDTSPWERKGKVVPCESLALHIDDRVHLEGTFDAKKASFEAQRAVVYSFDSSEVISGGAILEEPIDLLGVMHGLEETGWIDGYPMTITRSTTLKSEPSSSNLEFRLHHMKVKANIRRPQGSSGITTSVMAAEPGSFVQYDATLRKNHLRVSQQAIANKLRVLSHPDTAGRRDGTSTYATMTIVTDRASGGAKALQFEGAPPITILASEPIQSFISALGDRLIPEYQRRLPKGDASKIDFRFYVVRSFHARLGSYFVESAGGFPGNQIRRWNKASHLFYTRPDDAAIVQNLVATPDGTIMVPDGLLFKLTNTAQLASLLSAAITSVLQLQDYSFSPDIVIPNGLERSVGSYSFDPWGVNAEQVEQTIRIGLRSMFLAGYDVREAPAAWASAQNRSFLNPMLDISDANKNLPFFASYAASCVSRYFQNIDYSKQSRGESEFRDVLGELRLIDPDAPRPPSTSTISISSSSTSKMYTRPTQDAYSDNHWAGPGGAGPPGGTGDWRASMHDYNFATNGPNGYFDGKGITIGMYFNPTLSPATSSALIQSNNYLLQTGGYQGAKEKLFFGVVNAFQWASHIF